MKTAAIICEYNPFHNGHKYLADEARRICGESARVIAVMSGNYVQRGEPSLVHKWARTRAALSCGIDAVVELPSVYAASSAQFFAEAAVNIINNLGCVDCLVFGSESGDTVALTQAANLKISPTEDFKNTFDKALSEGLAYPAAMQKALSASCGINENILSNDILGIEYIKALILSNSAVKPIAIKRQGTVAHTDTSLPTQSENDTEVKAAFASANSIRYILSLPESVQTPLDKFIPAPALTELQNALLEQGGPITLADFEQFIFASIMTLKPSGLRQLPFVTEGLENKIYSASCSSKSLSELIDKCTGTRYTRTRITRILTSLITGAKSTHFPVKVPYIRVLGIRKSSKELLSLFDSGAKNSNCDLIKGNIPARFRGLTEVSKSLLDLEATATDIYFLATQGKEANAEFSRGLIIF